MYHLLRSVQLAELLRAGIPFSRWAPDMVWGYGYPLFNYYPPLAYYLVNLINLACGDLVVATNVGLVVISALASLAMYLWTSELYGAKGGVVAAAAYVFAPYLIANTFRRYALAEQFALALLPLILYWLTRLARTRRPVYGICAALTWAATIATHNTTALLAAPFVAAYALYLASRRSTGLPFWRALAPLCLSMALGLLLAAWYWLPALAESGMVQLDRLTLWEVFDYRRHFLTLSQVFRLPEQVSPLLLNQNLPSPMAHILLPLILAGLSALGLVSRSMDRRLWLGLSLAFGATLFLALDLSAALWGRVGPLQMLQFPWRLLGLAMVFLAPLAGASLPALERWLALLPGRAWSGAALAGVLVACLVGHTAPWQRALYCHEDIYPVTIASLRAHGTAQLDIGTTTTGEYLPATVRSLPMPQDASEERAPRVARALLPDGATLRQVRYGPLSETVVVETASALEMVFNTFAFPGWQAEVDGQPVAIQPTSPNGLIRVAVPAGLHTVSLAFGSTPIRRIAEGLSLAGIGLAVAWLSVARWRRREVVPQGGAPSATLPPWQALLIALLGIAALALARTPLHRPAAGQASASFAYAGTTYDGNLTLLAVEELPSPAAGEPAVITLYWQLARPSEERYSVSVQLVDARGNLVAQGDEANPGGAPCDAWLPAPYYVRDTHTLRIPYGMAPGAYQLQLVVYRQGDIHATLAPRGADGGLLAAPLALGDLHVQSGGALPLDYATQATFEEQITLLGADLPEPVCSGQEARLVLYWRAGPVPMEGLSVSLRVLDGNGRIVAQRDHEAIAGRAPADWLAGYIYEEPFQVTLPPGLSPGAYHVNVRVYRQGLDAAALEARAEDGRSLGSVLAVGDLAVTRPKRPLHVDDLPLEAGDEQAVAPGLVLLGGAELPSQGQAGQDITFVTYWQAEAKLHGDLAVILRLRDADGVAVLEQEVPPAPGWPTSAWRRGEIWRGLHTLSLPAWLEGGQYRLEMQGQAGVATLGNLRIDAPERCFQEPSTRYAAGETLGGLATLVGYSLPESARPGEALEVRLVWQAQATASASHKSFVQLLDGEGQLIVGSDAIPAGWQRPTTGWVPGEFIEDVHLLALPEGLAAGEYRLIVGLYQEASLQRLTTEQGDDAIWLAQPLRIAP